MSSITLNIYGDSIARFTVVDAEWRYHSLAKPFLERLRERFGVEAVNRAHFGYTVERGHALLERDLSQPLRPRYALLEYGGNDCDFDWKAVAAAPEDVHEPKTPLARFTSVLSGMADELIASGVQPVLMTLPPIDAQRYFDCIVRCGADGNAVLRWLGDVQMIYRFQELYSGAVGRLAAEKGLPLLDVRSRFLDRHDYSSLLCADGIHPSEDGYALLCAVFEERLAALSAL